MDFERARHWMVKAQVRVNDVTDPGIQAAMRRLPRERFAPARPDIAYSDNELEVAPGRVL
jgi:protein-L-isoaspartate(D-aspartate) O-methyltransferase